MDEGDAMKMKLVIFALIGIFVGLVISLITYEGIHRTAGEDFCVSCHEMRPMVSAYHNDVHGGVGKTGIKVSCVSCHLPQDNILNYIFTKAKNGVAEVGIHFLGNPDDIDWYEMRTHRKYFVYDQGCINCHTNFQSNANISKKGIKMHEHYMSLKDTDKRVGCASCHVEVGHKGLRSSLNYYKPEYEYYEGKLDEYKETAEKKLNEKDIGWFK
jgi:nitrate/TMAO reductase-like tetraheme cytochrome c subunit